MMPDLKQTFEQNIQRLAEYTNKYCKFPGKNYKIAVAMTWDSTIKNAEYEVIKRLSIAIKNIGCTLVATDNNGFPVWNSNNDNVNKAERITSDDVDFLISLHFLSPKLVDVYSYYAVWQPIAFYFDFGYENTTKLISTHDDGLSCDSEKADAHIKTLISQVKYHCTEKFPYLFHSPPESHFTPKISKESRLFYVGVNWERLGKSKKGRFSTLMKLLDQNNLVDIYGPRKLLGVAPWEGYECYRGEIPFDGESLVKALNHSGICFAMSSKEHIETGIMSNRLFEGLAAGCAIIANKHPIIEKYFADVVWVIDDELPEEEMYFHVANIIDEIRNNPEEASHRALKGQKRFNEYFSMEKNLCGIINQHNQRKTDEREKDLETLTVIMLYEGASKKELLQMIDNIKKSEYIKIKLFIVGNESLFTHELNSIIKQDYTRYFDDVKVLTPNKKNKSYGRILSDISRNIDTNYFSFYVQGEEIFRNHYTLLARKLNDDQSIDIAASGVIEEISEIPGLLGKREVSQVKYIIDVEDFITSGEATYCSSQFMYRTKILEKLDKNLLELIHNHLSSALILMGIKSIDELGVKVGASGKATLVRLFPDYSNKAPISDKLKWQEFNFLCDKYTFLKRNKNAKTNAQKTSQPVVLIDKMYNIDSNEECDFLAEGFHDIENNGVWTKEKRAKIIFGFSENKFPNTCQFSLKLDLGFSPTSKEGEFCIIKINSFVMRTIKIIPNTNRNFEIDIPKNVVQGEQKLEVELLVEEVHSAPGSDVRKLGVFLQRIMLCSSENNIQQDSLNINKKIDLRGFSIGGASLVSGAKVEEDGITVYNKPARFYFKLDSYSTQLMALIKVNSSNIDIPDSSEIKIRTTVNGITYGVHRLDQEKEYMPIYFRGNSLNNYNFEIDCDKVLPLIDNPEESGSTKLKEITFYKIYPAEMNKVYKCTDILKPGQYLTYGFSSNEKSFTWIDGKYAILCIGMTKNIHDSSNELSLILRLRAREDVDASQRECKIIVNDAPVADLKVGGNSKNYKININRNTLMNDVLIIEIMLNECPPQVVDSKTQEIVDKRRLGICIEQFELQEEKLDEQTTE